MANSELDLDVDPLLECSICLEQYNDPRALPCLHSFCLQCLRLHISQSKASDGAFPCPVCRNSITAANGDAGNFPKNFLLNSMKNAAPSTSQHFVGPEIATLCEPHKSALDWYCQTCHLAGCAECMLLQHRHHNTGELANMASKVELELNDLSKLATQRLATLQQISSDLDAYEGQMENDTTQAIRELSRAADRIRNLITKHEENLIKKVQEGKEAFQSQIRTSRREYEIAKDDTTGLKLLVSRLKAAKSPLRTILRAPIAKQEFEQTQKVPLLRIQWKMNRVTVKSEMTSEKAFLQGDVKVQTFVLEDKTAQADKLSLQAPLQVTKRRDDHSNAVGGIAPIYTNMVCLTVYDEFLWVYTSEGDLTRKVSIKGIKRLFGVVAVNGKLGQLAIVDGSGIKAVHYVTLSTDLRIQQHTTKDVPLAPDRISINRQRGLIVSSTCQKKFALVASSGELFKTVEVDIPADKVYLECIAETESGYVICDRLNRKVYFTDGSGRIVHVSTDCEKPGFAVQTSTDVLITDFSVSKIKVFSEVGDYLGCLRDSGNRIKYPLYVYVDDVDGLLYVDCQRKGGHELRIYKLAGHDRPALLMSPTVKETTLTFTLAVQ